MARAGLRREEVVQAAVAVVDAAGWAGLTMAAVADRLGIRPPSLYKHLASLDELRAAVAVVAVRELADELAGAAAGVSGTEALHRLCLAYRRFASSSPGRYAATLRAPGADAEAHRLAAERVLGTIAAVLAGYALTGDELVHAVRVLRSALHGFVELEAVGGFGMPVDPDRSFDEMVRALDLALGRWTER